LETLVRNGPLIQIWCEHWSAKFDIQACAVSLQKMIVMPYLVNNDLIQKALLLFVLIWLSSYFLNQNFVLGANIVQLLFSKRLALSFFHFFYKVDQQQALTVIWSEKSDFLKLFYVFKTEFEHFCTYIWRKDVYWMKIG